MTNYNDKQLDKRIHEFLTKKMQKYPELDVKHRDNKTVSLPHLSFHMLGSTRFLHTQ